MAKEQNLNEGLLFPYYINQPRMFDVFAILNGGYDEYSEITTTLSTSDDTKNRKKSGSSLNLKVVDLGKDGMIEDSSSSSTSNQVSNRRIQTTTSMLSNVIRLLNDKGYIKEREYADTGDFVILPVNIRVNSLKGLLEEMEEINTLAKRMQELSPNAKVKTTTSTLSKLKKMSEIVRNLFPSEEIVHEQKEFGLVGTISDQNLYQSKRADIIGTDLDCLAQIRRFYPEGTQLFKNTIFAKMNSSDEKNALINAFVDMTQGAKYNFEATAIPEITGKPVYEVEIIALYQTALNHQQPPINNP